MAGCVGAALGLIFGFFAGAAGGIAIIRTSDLHGFPLEVVTLGMLLGTIGGFATGIWWKNRRRPTR